jgi:hypothetical protein
LCNRNNLLLTLKVLFTFNSKLTLIVLCATPSWSFKWENYLNSLSSKTVTKTPRPSNPQLTPTTLQIQYCDSYSYEILPTCTYLDWKHTNKWRNICTFQIPSVKKNSNVVAQGSAILKTCNPTCHAFWWHVFWWRTSEHQERHTIYS